MKLTDIIEYINPKEVINQQEVEINNVSYNSKSVKQGDIFVCLVGEHTDGHNYAKNAQENGASAILAEKKLDDINIPTLIVEDTKYSMAKVASLLNNFPSKELNFIGVTGTNGKTTVTHLIETILEKTGRNCGLIGTLGQRLNSNEGYKDAKHTTPQSPELQQTLRKMSDSNIDSVVMEVSSHALEQYRVGDCEFNGAVFTNLTQDHLDYHITMDNYFKAKSKLFKMLEDSTKQNKYAVINIDDPSGSKLIEIIPENVKVLTYGINNKADITAKNIEFSTSGSTFNCLTPEGEYTINLQLTGMFSIYNALAALTTGLAENIDINTCIEALESTKGVIGRFETITKEPLAIVDYAHTPDGLENVLKTAKEIVPENGKLICVFGCGGDRDATKRPKMGKIAEDLADFIIVTSDNPRSEDPQQIITDILTGIKSLNSEKILVEIDRKSAIQLAMKNATKNDIIVVAGKGHEDYQILKDKTIHFDDREEVKIAFNEVFA